MKNAAKTSRYKRLITGLAVLLVALLGALWMVFALAPQPPSDSGDVVAEQRPARRDFSLTDTNNQDVTLHTYQGKWVLMFFGFTMCPEVCPMAMQTVGATLDEMGAAAASLQPVFVTIDPERDTPAVLKDYLAHFADNIAGLSGTAAQTASIAKAYGVFYRKRAIEGDYTMDHSTALYLVAPDGTFVRPFRADVDPSQLAADLTAAMTALN
jgi:cytochrome oxidase Cu insertion factor (SCO1/SenC/PrrC family)